MSSDRPTQHYRSACSAYTTLMKAVFTTMDVHPRHRFEYWRDVACENLVDHNSVADCPQTFQADLRSGGLGEISLVSFATSPMKISHTKRQAGLANPKEIFIYQQLTGVLTLEQGGREIKLEPVPRQRP